MSAVDSVFADYDYVYDLANQLTGETHHGQTSDYTHDLAGQLTAADHQAQTDESYAYDANGNRITVGYMTGPDNQLISDGTFTYAYDPEGNLIHKTETATGNITVFTWDHRNRLTSVIERTASGTVLMEANYVYDVFDRRITKSVDADGAGLGGTETTHFLHNGFDTWADASATGAIIVCYLHGNEIDELLARFRPGEGTAWYLADHLGTVRDIVDANGALIDHIDYDSFGNVVIETSPQYGDRFKFTAREYDAETGLYYYRARFYDPTTGRFIETDPLAFDGGQANLYVYVANQSLEATDPLGTTTTGSYLVPLRQIVGTIIITSARFVASISITAPGFSLTSVASSFFAPTVVTLSIFAAVALIAGPVIYPQPGYIGGVAPPGAMANTLIYEQGRHRVEAQVIRIESTPSTNPEKFEPVKGTPGKKHKDTGEIWEKDKLHKDHWEVYKNRKDYANGERDRSVWEDGRPKDVF